MTCKRLVLVMSILCFSLVATGCGEKLYTMTEEEETIISLYAAKMVTKFNKNQTTGICNARVRPGELDEVRGLNIEEISQDENFEEDEISSVDIDTESSSNVAEVDNSLSANSVSDLVGVEGMEFQFAGNPVDISDEFQATSSFVLTSTPGKSYIAVYLYGTNVSDNEINFSNSNLALYRLSVNGGPYEYSQNTFLDNDLALFTGKVAPKETLNFLLVFQVSNSNLENDNLTLKLESTRDGNSKSITLNINQL